MDSTGKIIKMLRKKRGLSQEELGVILGVRKSAIQKYENGSIQNIKMDVLRQLCYIFEIPPSLLVFPECAKHFFMGLGCWDEIAKSSLELNHEGRKKVKQYIDDLLLIEKYKFVEPPGYDQKEVPQEDLNV